MRTDRWWRDSLSVDRRKPLGELGMDLYGSLMSFHRGPTVAVRFSVPLICRAFQAILPVACPDRAGPELVVPVIKPEPLALPGIARQSDETAWGRDPCPLEVEAPRVEGGGRPSQRPEPRIPASERRQHQRHRSARAEALLDGGGQDRMRPDFEKDLEPLLGEPSNGFREPGH